MYGRWLSKDSPNQNKRDLYRHNIHQFDQWIPHPSYHVRQCYNNEWRKEIIETELYHKNITITKKWTKQLHIYYIIAFVVFVVVVVNTSVLSSEWTIYG
mmetsp:Transcript_61108/g.68422  ORF Transcript_61108/g.68422 Transcript_61108/m.68422 type:complete len:99 (+) Transcript_61108:331-627(+)